MNPNSLKKLNRHLLRQALDAVAAPALIIDAQLRERKSSYANAALGQAIGLHPNEIIGRPADSLADSAFDPASPEPWRPRSSRGPVELRPTPLYDQPGKASYWLLTAPGTVPAVAMRPVAVGTAGTTPSMAGTGVFMATDVWARSLRDDRTDAATGIPGRNALQEVLLRDWSIARRSRSASVSSSSVLMRSRVPPAVCRHATEALLRKVAHSLPIRSSALVTTAPAWATRRFAVLIGAAEERTWWRSPSHRSAGSGSGPPSSAVTTRALCDVSWSVASEFHRSERRSRACSRMRKPESPVPSPERTP